MENKNTCFIGTALRTAGVLLLLAAAFNVLPVRGNVLIFLALACFLIATVAKRSKKGGSGSSCCK